MSERRFRASSISLLTACPESHAECEMTIDEETQPARLGSAVHRALELMVLGQHVDLGEISTEYGVDDFEELRKLFYTGRARWRDSLQQAFPNPLAEVQYEHVIDEKAGIVLTGHADLVSRLPTESRVLDFKSGWLRRDAGLQLASYAILEYMERRKNGEEIERVVVTQYDVRFNSIITTTETPDVLRRHVVAFRETIEMIGSGRFVVGEHCAFCPRYYICPARSAMVSAALGDIGSPSETVSKAIEGFRLHELRAIVKQVKKAVEIVEKEIKDQVAARGTVLTGDGHELYLQHVTTRKILPRVAWPVLAKHLTEDEIANAMTISLGECRKVVSARAEHGQKSAAADELEQALTDAGAFAEGGYTKLGIRKETEDVPTE